MSSRVGFRLLAIAIAFLGVTATVTVTRTRAYSREHAQQGRPLELASRVHDLLNARCFQCHGQNGVARNNIFVVDHARLLSSKTVVPGDSGSLLLKVVESETMPLGGPPLSTEEKATLRRWVLEGAPDWDSRPVRSAARTFISEGALTAFIRDDLERAGERTRPFLRYFSIAHLYNAGLPEEELETHRVALSKLINSLSWHRDVTPPAAIGPARTLFRIDLRDYEWTAATWNNILAVYPYGIRAANSEQISRLSGADLPYVRADWFLATASIPPLYDELLGLPRTVAELERLAGADGTRSSAGEDDVVRAGVRNSGVSQNNRVLERHPSVYGAYWRSFDFASSLDDQSIFKDPIRLNPAGGEIIFNLPNGLQAYFLVNGQGRRIDAAPVAIVADRNNPDDPVVRNGRSCMSCHYDGIRPFKDDVRPVISRQTVGFFERDRALVLYPPQETLDRLIEKDRLRFQRAVEQAGAVSTGARAEPINSVGRRFNAELNLNQAACELGIETALFEARVRRSAALVALGYGQLLVPDGAFKRDAWERNFGVAVSELQVGDYVNPIRGESRPAFLPVASAGQQRTLADDFNRRLSRSASVNTNPTDLLRAARTVFVRSETVFLKPAQLEHDLRSLKEFEAMGLMIVKDQSVADLVVNLDRPLFTYTFTFTVTNSQNSVLLMSGKVIAFDGNLASPRIAKEVLKHLAAARSLRNDEKKTGD
ncbi:MAG TPA: hypothetical protein VFV34_28970 [Blastocatellia bacterium]|nr:hypothetical protein [Blastocatellia bacterium]